MIGWYKEIIQSTKCTGMVETADSFPGVVLSLNTNASSNKYLCANTLVLLTAALSDGNLFHTKYK